MPKIIDLPPLIEDIAEDDLLVIRNDSDSETQKGTLAQVLAWMQAKVGWIKNTMLASENGEVLQYTPGGNVDYSSSTLGDYFTVGDATIPAWATKARVTWFVNYLQPLTAANAMSLNLKIGSATGRVILAFSQNAALSDSKACGYTEEITLTGTGTQSVKFQAQRTSGASGGSRLNTSSDICVRLDYY